MQAPSDGPVFYDASHKRWPWVRGAFLAFSFAVFVLLVCLSISITINPVLPALGLPSGRDGSQGTALQPPTAGASVLPPSRPRAAFQETRRRLMEERKKAQTTKRKTKKGASPSVPEPASPETLCMAFYSQGDAAAFSSLKQNIESLDVLIPDWLRLLPDGKLEPLDFAKQREVSDFVRQAHAETKLVPLLSNYNGKKWEGQASGELLSGYDARAELIRALMDYSRNFPLDGFCLRLEHIPARLQGGYAGLIGELAARLHAESKVLYVCASVELVPFTCRHAAKAGDMVILLAHGQPHAAGASGPLAAHDWFEEVINRRALDVPPEKLGVAFGSYVRDWTEAKGPGALRTFDQALLAFGLEPREDKSLLWWLYPQRFCYRQLMYYVAIKSTLAALRGVEVGWGKLERKATVTTPVR